MTPLRNYYDTKLVNYVVRRNIGKLQSLFITKSLLKKVKMRLFCKNENDWLIYRLCDLTDEEITIVEGK